MWIRQDAPDHLILESNYIHSMCNPSSKSVGASK